MTRTTCLASSTSIDRRDEGARVDHVRTPRTEPWPGGSVPVRANDVQPYALCWDHVRVGRWGQAAVLGAESAPLHPPVVDRDLFCGKGQLGTGSPVTLHDPSAEASELA